MNEQTAAESPEEGEEAATRQRSKIAFPYTDLSAALKVARGIHDNVGSENCSLQQLAAWMGSTTSSSMFRMQVATSRLFGFIESEGAESYRLTSLGRRVFDPMQERKAKVEAFLEVPLFSAIFNNHKEGVLPPPAALEREIAALGVADKQKDRARQVFERSADQAGFFEHGKNRLVLPAIKSADAKSEVPPPKDKGGGGGGGGGGEGDGLALDPLLMALLKKIPAAGQEWPAPQRLRWFRTFAMNVSQVYDADSDDPVELKIDAPSPVGTKEGGQSG